MLLLDSLRYIVTVIRYVNSNSESSEAQIEYEKDDIVQEVSERAFLFKPEQVVLNKLQNRLSDMKMLDIGMGGGRTTAFFAPLVKAYVGIDYSQKMIWLCQKKFTENSQKLLFKRADARKLVLFRDDEFDFVLFSFNGMDVVDYEDRAKILKEIHRICKNNAYFLFSAHNINFLQFLCSDLSQKIH